MAVMSGMSRTKRFVLARIFPWVVVLAGAAATNVGTETVFRARASLAWPAADGTITNSNVELERTNTSE